MLNQQPRSTVPEIGFPALTDPQASRMLALQYQLEASQWMPAATLLSRQLEQLQRVYAHARRTVPYYARLFAGHGPGDGAEFSLEFLRKLPISTRVMVQQAGDQMRSDALPPAHGKAYPVSTSGSTGQPVKLQGTAATNFIWQALTLREHAWHERDFSRRLCAIKWAAREFCRPPDGERYASWGDAVAMLYDSAPSAVLNVITPLAEQAAWLLREQPGYLVSFPSNLAALATHCLERKIAFPGLAEVRTIGETLTTAQRALYRQAWGVDTVDIYSCEETGYLALQCPGREHYHVQAESVLVEIVDEDGRPCGPGASGRVLVSSLHNFATPLLRYELGDYAAFGEACSCGRSLPVIETIHGRRRNRLILPDGRSEFPYLGEHGQTERLTGVSVRAFQFVQHSVEEVEMKLVTDRRFTAEETDQVARMVQNNLGHPFRIRITHCDAIPRSVRGKFEEFVSLVGL
jgi:phenylacetate-coenzyme A ligase PaaK-like adenylate-forming protein